MTRFEGTGRSQVESGKMKRKEISGEEKTVRRNLTILIFLICATLSWSACGGSSNTSGNAGRIDTDMSVNSERVESSNIAPTGGPGPEPESKGTQSSANTNDNKTDNKNRTENKNTQ